MTHPRERWLLRLCAYQKFLTAALVRPGSMRAMAAGGSMQQHAGQQPRQLLAACLQERQRICSTHMRLLAQLRLLARFACRKGTVYHCGVHPL